MTERFFNLIKRITPARWHWILEHGGYRRYFLNTSWMLVGKIVSLLASFFVGVWVARYLGPGNYGILNYATAFVGLFSFIAPLGVDSIIGRELIKYPEKRDELLGTAFGLKVFGGVLAFSLTIVSVLIFENNYLIKILVSLFSFSLILQSLNIIDNYFSTEVKSKDIVFVNIFSTIISALLKILIIFFGGGIILIISVYTLEFLWKGIGYIIVYKKFGLNLKKWIFNKNLSRRILKNSWPLMLASAASFIYLKVDQVMIGKILDPYSVGIYSAAVRLVEVWYFVPGIICSSLFPAIINAKKTSKYTYTRRLNNLYILLLSISILMATPIMFLARPIIFYLFGVNFASSVPVLQIYIWSSVGLFLSSGINQYLISENRVRLIFILNIITMIINIALNLLLIPKIGIIGSAWATLISYFVIPVFLLIFNTKKQKHVE